MLNGILIPVGLALVAIFGIGVVVGILYKRSTRDQAYVRTGLGGKKVVLDGGSVVLPVFHSMAGSISTPCASKSAAAKATP